MDFQLNEDQAALVDALQSILQRYAEPAQDDRLQYAYFEPELRQALEEGGFLEAATTLGPLEAALVVIETSRLPCVAEVGASALVAPNVVPQDMALAGPIALVRLAEIGKAQRNLPIARTAIIDTGDDVVILPVEAGTDVEPVRSIFAYPYGRFRQQPDLAGGRSLGSAAVTDLRQWWRVAVAAEFAGSLQAAVDFTVDYVKERHVFGKPIGALQAVQHRLAQCHQIARACHYLTLRAAWSGTPELAEMAACYAQQHAQKLVFDLHQFNGGMGVTSEHKLHFWTFRLRALQSELGGADGAALDLAERLWGSAA